MAKRQKKGLPSGSPPPTTTASPQIISPPTPPAVEVDAAFWRPLLIAVETKPIGIQKLRGVSGVEHRLVDVGVDDSRDRLVILTDTPDPKVSAFIQSDLQRAHPNQKVVVARVVLVRLVPTMRRLLELDMIKALSLNNLKTRFANASMTNRVLKIARGPCSAFPLAADFEEASGEAGGARSSHVRRQFRDAEQVVRSSDHLRGKVGACEPSEAGFPE